MALLGQREVLRLVARGLSTHDIAKTLFIGTVASIWRSPSRCHRRHAVAVHRPAPRRRLRPEEEHAAAGMTDRSVALVHEALREAGHDLGDVVGAVVGLPAPVVSDTGRVGASGIAPAWVGHEPATEFRERLGVPVLVENDANLGALSEYLWGAGRGSQSLVYLLLTTGVGAGLVVDGKIFRGVSGTAGEIGHITLDANGDLCRCGIRGCLDLVAGGTAVVRQP